MSIRASALQVRRGLECAASRARCLASFAASTYRSWRPHMTSRYPRSPSCFHAVIRPARCAAISASRSVVGVSTGPQPVEPRVRSVLSRGSLASRRPEWACPPGQLNRTIRAREGGGRVVDHIVLVYYCGHTGQRSLLGGPPSRVSPCVLPGSVQAPWARREHPAPNRLGRSGDGAGVAILGAAVPIVARRRIGPAIWTAASGVRPRKGPVGWARVRRDPGEVFAVATRRRAEGGRSAIEDRGLR